MDKHTIQIQKMAERIATNKVAEVAANALDGLDKRQALRQIYWLVGKAKLDGFFHDQNWAPIHRLWKVWDDAGVQVDRHNSWYTKDERGTPASKTWAFKIEWLGPKGQAMTANGQVVASGGGSSQDPLDRYDVTCVVS